MIPVKDEFAMLPDDEFIESNVTEMLLHWFRGTLFTVVPFTWMVAFVSHVTVIVFEDERFIEFPEDTRRIVLLFAVGYIEAENERSPLMFGNVTLWLLPLNCNPLYPPRLFGAGELTRVQWLLLPEAS